MWLLTEDGTTLFNEQTGTYYRHNYTSVYFSQIQTDNSIHLYNQIGHKMTAAQWLKRRAVLLGATLIKDTVI